MCAYTAPKLLQYGVRHMANNKKRLWFLRGIAILLMLASGYIAWYTIAKGTPRDFWQDHLNRKRGNLQNIAGTFTDQDGKQVTLKNFADKNIIATFVFKDCNMSCPIIMNDLRLFEKNAPDFARSGNFLIFTFEDHRKNPEELREFLKKYRIEGDHWRVLTADAATIRKLADTFELQYNKGEAGNYIYAHSNVFIVADKNGVVRREFRGIENNKAKFFEEVRKFL